MVVQYPHTLTTQQVSGMAVANSSGDYTASVTETLNLSPCRAEMNGAGSTVPLTDGTAYVFGSLIQLPLSAPDVKEGTPLEVVDSDGLAIASGAAKRFQRGQLHCRLWV